MLFCDRIVETYSLPKGKCCTVCHDESDGGIYLVKIDLRDVPAVVCCNLLKTLTEERLIKEEIHG